MPFPGIELQVVNQCLDSRHVHYECHPPPKKPPKKQQQKGYPQNKQTKQQQQTHRDTYKLAKMNNTGNNMPISFNFTITIAASSS